MPTKNVRIAVTWGNDCDIGDTLYQTGFKNIIYFDSIIGLPQTKTITEGNQNGDQKLIPSFQKRSKQYEFQVWVPEFVVDALADIRLHKNIKIRQWNPDIEYQITDPTSFNISGNYEFVGCHALITVSFEADEVVVKSGCCDDVGLAPCVHADYTVIGCGTDQPANPQQGDFYLYGGPKVGAAPGYYDFKLNYLTTSGWLTKTVKYGTYVLCGTDYYIFQTTKINGIDVDVWGKINTLISAVLVATDTISFRIKTPPGTWNKIEYSGDCINFDTLTPEIWAEDLEISGYTKELEGLVPCGIYCLRVTSRKEGCTYEPVMYQVLNKPDPLVIDFFVNNVYLANLCPVPVFGIGTLSKAYLILPETPCTNLAAICDHQNEIIYMNPLTHVLSYITPTDCMVVYDRDTGDYWVYNSAAGTWQLIVYG